ncbi:metal-dependent hydrolase [Thiococcus pfennigii]|uniref:metal-dependent hydrolase n=1 Tax=Thiococcus pfennigii TaxID=1057 RepID=UPI001904755B|nr:metal-dependent hydrolase [Thiococcus pfennigii]MBK1732765.1 hypothetical protein [Thiococcus pfennigii]
MLTPTHLLFAQTSYLGACVVAAHPPAAEEAAVALLGSLIPDLDTRASYIGRVLRLTSGTLERYFGHRTFTHALLPQALVGLLAWWLLPFGFALALLAGWVSHSWADMMTKSGVAWFWPARIRCVLPGNPDYRMDVAKGGELAFLLVVALIGILLMPLAETGKGTAGLIRGAIGDLASVRADYDRDKGDFRFEVAVKGRDNLNHSDISGTYPVIGPWRESGLIVASDAGPRSLCAGSACDWYSSHAKLERGARIATSTVRIEVPRIEVAALREQAAALAAAGEVFLIGTAEAEGVRPQPPALETAGDRLTLAYAAPAILERLRGRSLRQVDLVLQVRHAPGAEVPDIAPPAPGGAPVPPLLERWLK